MNMTANDYPYVRAWGLSMGSDARYIEDQVAAARRDQAPEDAIYWHGHGDNRRWRRYQEVTQLSTRAQMGTILQGRFGITAPPPDPAAMREAARRGLERVEQDLATARATFEHWDKVVQGVKG